ncbi:MAG: hypothetical protein WC868_07900, partial [Bacteroidales bacterium]
LLALFVVAGMVAFVACGPNTADKAKKAKEDSTRIADSTAKVERDAFVIDSTNQVALKAKEDSTKKADSIAKKGGKKEVKKVK